MNWSLKELCLAVALCAYWDGCAPWCRRALAMDKLVRVVVNIDRITQEYLRAHSA